METKHQKIRRPPVGPTCAVWQVQTPVSLTARSSNLPNRSKATVWRLCFGFISSVSLFCNSWQRKGNEKTLFYLMSNLQSNEKKSLFEFSQFESFAESPATEYVSLWTSLLLKLSSDSLLIKISKANWKLYWKASLSPNRGSRGCWTAVFLNLLIILKRAGRCEMEACTWPNAMQSNTTFLGIFNYQAP